MASPRLLEGPRLNAILAARLNKNNSRVRMHFNLKVQYPEVDHKQTDTFEYLWQSVNKLFTLFGAR